MRPGRYGAGVLRVITKVWVSGAATPSESTGFLPATISGALRITSTTCAYCEAVTGSTRRLRPAAKSSATSGSPLIYVKGEGIVLNEPSVVAIEKATGKIKGIGLEAKRMLGRTPDGILAVRPLKDGVIADFDVTEKMLRYFLKTIIDKHVFRVKPKVIVCVPSGITEVERRAVRDSAETAGAKQVLMVAEPMAAAIGVGLPVETPTGNMVIDIGGGTTEIAVIALSGIVSDTSIRTGGDELDQAIVQFMRKNYNLLVGEPTAEAIKIKIGSAAPTGDEREMEVKGRDLVSGIPKTVRVHSTEIREAVQEPIQQRSSMRYGARWRSRPRSSPATSWTGGSS